MNQPWMDKDLSADARAELQISELTLDELISLVHGPMPALMATPHRCGFRVPRYPCRSSNFQTEVAFRRSRATSWFSVRDGWDLFGTVRAI